MKQFYNPGTLYSLLRTKHVSGTLLNSIIPSGSYCTENILWAELLEHQTELPSLNVIINLFGVANRLQVLRDTVFNNSPITVNSAFRSKEYNETIGGEPNSKHTLGQAIDFTISGLSPLEVQTTLKNHSGGLGSYKNFTHIDIASKRRWKG